MTLSAALALVQTCAPGVHPATLLPIAYVESSWRTDALHRNRNGTIDYGFGQINDTNFSRLGLTRESVLDPCSNVRAAAAILGENYLPAAANPAAQQSALRTAIAKYHTGPNGDPAEGERYVRLVENAARRIIPALNVQGLAPAPPLPQPQEQADDPNDPRPPSWDLEGIALWRERHERDPQPPPAPVPAVPDDSTTAVAEPVQPNKGASR